MIDICLKRSSNSLTNSLKTKYLTFSFFYLQRIQYISLFIVETRLDLHELLTNWWGWSKEVESWWKDSSFMMKSVLSLGIIVELLENQLTRHLSLVIKIARLLETSATIAVRILFPEIWCDTYLKLKSIKINFAHLFFCWQKLMGQDGQEGNKHAFKMQIKI